MKSFFCGSGFASVLVGFSLASLAVGFAPVQAQPKPAAETHSASQVKEDIQRHRAMSAAHEAAAKCLESGKKDDVCEKELQAACKGLAIGRYCGMKHVH